MPIISISLDEKMLHEIDCAMLEKGFSGRSEIVRAAIQMLLRDSKELTSLAGIIDATLIIFHSHKKPEQISTIAHAHQDIVKTRIHNCLANDKCLEIFVLKGDAKKIVKMADEFKSCKKIWFSKLIVS